MAGRPRKLNANKTGHFTKDQLEEAEMQENGLNAYEPLEVDKIPEDLNEKAMNEWLRIVPLLSELPIAELDMTMVKNYCQLVGIQEQAYADMQELGTFDPETHKRTGPYLVYMDTHKELKSVCGKLGLTIDSRMRLVVPEESQESQSIFQKFGMDDD